MHRKLGDTLCKAVPGYQAFMGCDYTAVFRGKSIRIGLQEKKKIDGTETGKYVCGVYSRKRLASIDEVRLELVLKKMQTKGKQINFKYEKVW